MFEPQLDHHRRKYDRLGRWQRRLVLGGPLLGAALLITLALTSAPDWTDFLLVVLVFLIMGAMVALEIERVLIFRRDMRDRRRKAGHTPVSIDHNA